MTTQLFRWVTINSEADLPTKIGSYMVLVKCREGIRGYCQLDWLPGWDKLANEDDYVDSYLCEPVTENQ